MRGRVGLPNNCGGANSAGDTLTDTTEAVRDNTEQYGGINTRAKQNKHEGSKTNSQLVLRFPPISYMKMDLHFLTSFGLEAP